MVSFRGQAAPGGRRGNRMGGGSGVRRRDGQRPDTWQAQPIGADQLRVGPAVLVLGRLAAQRLHRTDHRIGLRCGRVRRPVPVPARVTVLPDAGWPTGRRGHVLVVSAELHGRRSTDRTVDRQTLHFKRQVYIMCHNICVCNVYLYTSGVVWRKKFKSTNVRSIQYVLNWK